LGHIPEIKAFEMSEYPTFSVVIPTYNRGDLIEGTLESVLTQTYPHYEVVVVDDCSTDNTDEVIKPYVSSGKVRYFKNERNSERAHSRNVGLAAAVGDFATLLDSDDFMYPSNLADAAAFARANPDIKCFHNLYEFVNAERRVLRQFPLAPLKNQLKAIAMGNFMACVGDFMHRDIYKNYKFDTFLPLSGSEDWDFWLRVLADHKVGRIEKVNNGVLQHDGRSVNNQNIDKLRIGLEYVCDKIARDPHLAEVYRPYLNRIRSNSYVYLAILANGSGLFDVARHYLREAVNQDRAQLANPTFWRVVRRAWLKLQNL
jgi:glycosyltransferase involved in cell wall biosynthesis